MEVKVWVRQVVRVSPKEMKLRLHPYYYVVIVKLTFQTKTISEHFGSVSVLNHVHTNMPENTYHIKLLPFSCSKTQE